jgi:ribonuclease P protein component
MRPPPVKRVTGKRTFDTLHQHGRRSSSGEVAVHYLADTAGDGSIYVAYSVPRRIGTAVERNTYRRRLRAIVREVAGSVPPGTYLIGMGPGVRAVAFDELRKRVVESMKRASGARPQ